MLHNNLGVTLWAFEGPAPALEVMRAGIAFAQARGLAEMVDTIDRPACSIRSSTAAQFDEALEVAAGLAERYDERRASRLR